MSIDKIIVKLDKLGNISVENALERACLIVENSAREKAPVNTGNLRNSITHTVNGNEGVVGTNVEYAPYVEFGTGLFSSQGDGRQDVPWRYQDAEGNWHTTSGQNPQPFLEPALNENRGRIQRIFDEELREALK